MFSASEPGRLPQPHEAVFQRKLFGSSAVFAHLVARPERSGTAPDFVYALLPPVKIGPLPPAQKLAGPFCRKRMTAGRRVKGIPVRKAAPSDEKHADILGQRSRRRGKKEGGRRQRHEFRPLHTAGPKPGQKGGVAGQHKRVLPPGQAQRGKDLPGIVHKPDADGNPRSPEQMKDVSFRIEAVYIDGYESFRRFFLQKSGKRVGIGQGTSLRSGQGEGRDAFLFKGLPQFLIQEVMGASGQKNRPAAVGAGLVRPFAARSAQTARGKERAPEFGKETARLPVGKKRGGLFFKQADQRLKPGTEVDAYPVFRNLRRRGSLFKRGKKVRTLDPVDGGLFGKIFSYEIFKPGRTGAKPENQGGSTGFCMRFRHIEKIIGFRAFCQAAETPEGIVDADTAGTLAHGESCVSASWRGKKNRLINSDQP